ncbi:GNAT family N-acetyltransferase [Streptomyces goshikiensis]|uniref:GNAT family N-acetyltransferase n=1 Tax=Streptomyces goshikiensis TaxID=1942 RepID=UPI0037A24B12
MTPPTADSPPAPWAWSTPSCPPRSTPRAWPYASTQSPPPPPTATAPAHRRRGYAKATLAALLDHLEKDGVTLYELYASEGSAPLYEQLGFAADPALMRMTRFPSPPEGHGP